MNFSVNGDASKRSLQLRCKNLMTLKNEVKLGRITQLLPRSSVAPLDFATDWGALEIEN